MKHLHAFSRRARRLLPLALLGSCAAEKGADPIPVPPPNVFVHVKLTGTQGLFSTFEMKSYAHRRPDSTYTYVMYSQMGDWESNMPLRLPPQIDVEATLLFVACDGVKKALPPGGKVSVEILANGKVLKRTVLEATAAPYALPEVNTVALGCAER